MAKKKKNKKVDLSKDVMIEIETNGVVTFRNRKDNRNGDALPFYSVDTVEQAEQLILLVAKSTYDDEYLIPEFEGTVDAIFKLSEEFYQLENRRKENLCG